MKTILVTGFEPFGPDSVNPSWEAVSRLPETTEHANIRVRKMPVEYDRVAVLLKQAIEEEKPDAVICVGQAGGRAAVTPELVAINVKDASVPDNAGVSFSGEPVREDGPAAYFATIPVKAVAAAIRSVGVPAAVSYTAGAYVCNNIMYHLLYLLEHEYPGVQGGFIHIPFECGQVLGRSSSTPSLPLSLIREGLKAAVEETAKLLESGEGDRKEATGSTH